MRACTRGCLTAVVLHFEANVLVRVKGLVPDGTAELDLDAESAESIGPRV